MPKVEFAKRARMRPPPLSVADAAAAEALPLDLKLAIDKHCDRQGAIVADRAERLRVLRSIATDLQPLRALLDSCKCESSQQIAAEFNVAWAALVIDCMAWPDFQLPLLYVTGFPVVFNIADSGVYRPDVQPQEISDDDFKAGNTRMVSQLFTELENAALDPAQRERREQCWAKTKKEIAAGLVNGPFTRAQIDRWRGRGKWRCLGRNAILQKNKWRCIDNAKRSKHNKAQTLHERITCSRSDFPVTVAREFARRLPAHGIRKRRRAKLGMRHGTMDLKAAYRHVPTAQPEYTSVAVINTDTTPPTVVVCEVPGHNFGLASAVINFNRYPELAIVAARRLLWTVSEHYYDDADTTEPGWAKGSGQECLDTLCGVEFFGFGFDSEQTSAMKPSNEYLGAKQDLSQADSGFVTMDVSSSRREKIRLLVQAVRDAGELRSGMAATLCGKARFMLAPCYGGLGKACLPPLALRSHQKDARLLTDDLHESLDFIEFASIHMPPLRLPTLPDSRKAIVVFTDAEGKQRKGPRPPSGHLGFVVYHPAHGTVHAYGEVPPSIVRLMDELKKRSTYIGQFELIAAITPFISLPPHWFEGYPVELWLDNSGAMSALVRDYSGVPDCARIVNTFHFAIARLGLASLFIDFVNSESNPADVPSRAHELGAARAEALEPFGRLVPMTIPEFASADGKWMSLVDIARSVW